MTIQKCLCDPLAIENFVSEIMAGTGKKTTTDEVIQDLEARLAGTLRPVQPSSDVIQRLKDGLRFPDRAEIVVRLSDWRRLFFVFGGVMSGMLLLITVARVFFHLFGRRHA